MPTLPHDLTNGVTADADEVMANFDALNAAIDQATVTSLPGSPTDGQEIFYRAAVGVIWHLKWVAADSVWAKVGGPGLSAQFAGSQSSPGWNFNIFNFAASDPVITIPRAGLYRVRYEGVMSSTPGSGTATGFEVTVGTGGNVAAVQPAPAAGQLATMVLHDNVVFAVGASCRIKHQVDGTSGGFSFMVHAAETLTADPVYITG